MPVSEILNQFSMVDGSIIAIASAVIYVAWNIIAKKLVEIIDANKKLGEDIKTLYSEIDKIKRDVMSNDQLKEHLNLLLEPIQLQIENVTGLLRVEINNLKDIIHSMEKNMEKKLSENK